MSATRVNLRYRQRRATLFGVLLLLIAIPVIYSTANQIVGHLVGWLILASSLWLIGKVDRAVLDDKGEHLIHRRGFIVPMFNKKIPLEKIKGVRVGTRTTGTGDERQTRFPVSLRGVPNSTLLQHANPWFARVTAERLARLLDVPIDNRIWGESSERQARDVDTPLVERWRREGRTLERPPLPTKTSLRENVQSSSYSLSYPAEYPFLVWVVIALFIAAIPAVVDTGATGFFHTLPYRVVAAGCVIVAIFMLAFVGRSRMTIDEKRLTYRQGFSILPQTIRTDEIEEMFVQFDGIGFIGDRSAVWIGWTPDKDANEYIAAIVPYQLARIGRSLNESMFS